MALNKDKIRIIKRTERFIRSVFEEEDSAHDWWHIYRVHRMAIEIAAREGGSLFIIEMAALMHDLDDWKLNHTGESRIRNWLKSLTIGEDEVGKIIEITEQVSFKGAGTKNNTTSLEAQIVQDADRLDAMGAIGIARTFAYGGSKGRLIYHPEIKPEFHADFNSYKQSEGHTINHFYEKLLLLKDLVNTPTARKIAEERHRFMEEFLDHFYKEWDAKN